MEYSSKASFAIRGAYNKGYRVIDGCVISPSGAKRKLRVSIKGYYTFTMKVGKEAYPIQVHALLAFQKFGDSVFEEGVEVRHLDNIKLNISDDNIAIGTGSQNMQDKPKEQRTHMAIVAATNLRKFSDSEIDEIRAMHLGVKSYKRVMEEFGISSKGTLHRILNKEYITSV